MSSTWPGLDAEGRGWEMAEATGRPHHSLAAAFGRETPGSDGDDVVARYAMFEQALAAELAENEAAYVALLARYDGAGGG